MLSPKFPCDRFLRLYDGVEVKFTAVLIGTFGNDTSCLRRFLELPGKKILELHLTNEAGRKFNRLGSGEFISSVDVFKYRRFWEENNASLINSLSILIRFWAGFIYEYKNVDTYLSSGLESYDSIKSARNKIQVIKKYWPYKVVWNPLFIPDNYNAVRADYYEVHTDRPRLYPRNCIQNYDGYDVIKNGAVRIREHKGCKILLWWPELQGVTDRFIYPKERNLVLDDKTVTIVNKFLRLRS